MLARTKSRSRRADEFVPSKDVQNLRKIRDRNPLPVVEHKVQQADDDDDDSEDEQPPTKKQTKTSVAKKETGVKKENSTKQDAAEKGEKWDLYYRAMIEFCEQNVGKLPKQKLVYDFEGHKLNLGSFVDVLKQRHRGTGGRTPLSEEEKSQLEIMPAWLSGREKSDGEEQWELMYGLLKEFEKKEGKLPTTRNKEQFGDYEVKEIGIWVQTQKKRFEVKGGLNGLREEQLKSMREIPAWVAYEEKVSKRVAQAAQAAAQIAQVVAEAAPQEAEADVVEADVVEAIQPLGLSGLSILSLFKEKGKKTKRGGV
jgi:hypothetical protein